MRTQNSDTTKISAGAAQAAAGELDKANSTKMVVVGCKLPNGIILELGRPGESAFRRVRLNGANSSQLIGGAGLTDVSEEFISAWLKKHADLSFVQQRLIFVGNDVTEASAVAIDRSQQKTGFERLGRKDMPKGVEVDEDHMKASMADMSRIRRATQAA